MRKCAWFKFLSEFGVFLFALAYIFICQVCFCIHFYPFLHSPFVVYVVYKMYLAMECRSNGKLCKTRKQNVCVGVVVVSILLRSFHEILVNKTLKYACYFCDRHSG